MLIHSSRKRLLAVVALGAPAGALAAFVSPWQLAVLIGWDVAAATFVTMVWWSIARFTSGETREFATREDDGRVATSFLLLSASVASLVGVGFALFKASNANTRGQAALTVAAIVTVALSWVVVHTVFTLRYAREYYTPPTGGIDFKADTEEPDYQDFGYVAFTIGMTFQVSDTDVQSRKIRRTVMRHSLLSYLFGAVILAVVINVIASIVK
jgi:uncharacterized membrane protein